MPIQVDCPCGATYNVPVKRLGKKFRCYSCARELTAGDENPAREDSPAGDDAANDPYAAPPAFDSDAFPQIKPESPSGLYQRSSDTVAFDNSQIEQHRTSAGSGSHPRVTGSGSHREITGSGSYPQASLSGAVPKPGLSGANPQLSQSGELERLELERLQRELEQRRQEQAASRQLYAFGGLLFLIALVGGVGTTLGLFTTLQFAVGLFVLLMGASLGLRYYQSSREKK